MATKDIPHWLVPVLENIGINQQTRKNAFSRAVQAADRLGWHCAEDVKNCALEDLYSIVGKEHKPTANNTLVYGLNILLASVGRMDRIQNSVLRRRHFGASLSDVEQQWIQRNDCLWYSDFKAGFSEWMMNNWPTGDKRTMHIIAMACLMARMCPDRTSPLKWTIQMVNAALVEATLSALQDPRSLLKRKRGHRDGSSFDPVGTSLSNYRTAALRLTEYLEPDYTISM